MPALAGVNEQLVGVWAGGAAGTPPMTLRIESNGRCSIGEAVGKCQTVGGALFYQGPDGSVGTYAFRVRNGELTISGGDLAAPLVFRKGEPVPAPATASSPQTAAQPAAAAGRYTNALWGVDFRIPAAWKAVERDGMVLLGSDTEAGMMLVRFNRSVTRQSMLADYSAGLNEDGVALMPAARAEDFAAGAYKGLAGELAGVARDGSRLKVRAIGVLPPFGDAVLLLGLTTDEKYPQLKPRVDALAASVRFSAPKIPPANIAVSGQYFYYYSSSVGSYSREDSLSLCSNGMFGRKGETSASQPGQWGVAGQSGYAGSWTADGDGRAGTIVLTYRNGRMERLRYQKSGPDIVLDGKKYGRFGDGSCSKSAP
jgi:hypothetical protein